MALGDIQSPVGNLSGSRRGWITCEDLFICIKYLPF